MLNAEAIAEEQFQAAKVMLTAVAIAASRGACDCQVAADAVAAVELARAQLADQRARDV